MLSNEEHLFLIQIIFLLFIDRRKEKKKKQNQKIVLLIKHFDLVFFFSISEYFQ